MQMQEKAADQWKWLVGNLWVTVREHNSGPPHIQGSLHWITRKEKVHPWPLSLCAKTQGAINLSFVMSQRALTPLPERHRLGQVFNHLPNPTKHQLEGFVGSCKQRVKYNFFFLEVCSFALLMKWTCFATVHDKKVKIWKYETHKRLNEKNY